MPDFHFPGTLKLSSPSSNPRPTSPFLGSYQNQLRAELRKFHIPYSHSSFFMKESRNRTRDITPPPKIAIMEYIHPQAKKKKKKGHHPSKTLTKPHLQEIKVAFFSNPFPLFPPRELLLSIPLLSSPFIQTPSPPSSTHPLPPPLP